MRHVILKKEFFLRPALAIAENLLGKYLVMRQKDGSTVAQMITEVEAYDGFKDKASHASRGKTKRNQSMFEAGGIWYVYFVYGMYEILNIVVGSNGYPAALLIRGVEGVTGPGKVTRHYGITRLFDGLQATRTSGLWIEDRGVGIPTSHIKKSPRIGVDYAGPVWSKKRYRFFIAEDISWK